MGRAGNRHLRYRLLGGKFGLRNREIAGESSQVKGNQLFRSPLFGAEINATRQAVALQERPVISTLKSLEIDAEIPQQLVRNFTEMGRIFHGLAASVTNQGTVSHPELIALGMAAEVVVVVEDQNAGAGIGFEVEMRGRQAGNPAPDNDQVVAVFIAGQRLTPVLPAFTRQRMGSVE